MQGISYGGLTSLLRGIAGVRSRLRSIKMICLWCVETMSLRFALRLTYLRLLLQGLALCLSPFVCNIQPRSAERADIIRSQYVEAKSIYARYERGLHAGVRRCDHSSPELPYFRQALFVPSDLTAQRSGFRVFDS